LAALALSLAALPCLAEEPATADTPGPPVPVETTQDPEAAARVGCQQPTSESTEIVDKVQRGVYLGVCGTAQWFDSLFGTRRYDQDSDSTFGRIGVHEYWDDRDSFDTRLRMRVRVALPAMEDRLRLFFGRADEKEVIENASSAPGGSAPSSFQNVEDDAWLLGLGYSKQGKVHNGFDFGAGIRIRTPVDPFVKGSYRHNYFFGEGNALRARQTLFWRDSRGWGETTEIDFDHLLSPRLLLRLTNAATLAEDVRRLELYNSVVLFQSLGTRRALSYNAFISSVLNTDVPIENYGLELRFRRAILRRWLFLEARTSVTWPRETLEEEREINPGVGIGFEMYFGPVPDTQLR
jgi:hypothetical protein